MAKSSKGGKKKPRVARAVPVVSESAAPPLDAEELKDLAQGGQLDGAAVSEIDRALDGFVPPEPPAEGDNGAAGEGTTPAEEPAAPAASRAEVSELPPHLRKRKGRPGRRTRRELEKEVRELRDYLGKVAPGEEPPAEAPAAPVVIDYTEAGEMVGFVLEMIFEAMAEEKGDHWRMGEQKMARAKEHGARFIGPYLPKLGSLLPLMFFAGVVGKHSLAAWRIDKLNATKAPAASPPAPGGGQ